MSLLKAFSVALAAGVLLVTVLYISYILVPILVLGTIFFVAYLIFSEDTTSVSKKDFKPPY